MSATPAKEHDPFAHLIDQGRATYETVMCGPGADGHGQSLGDLCVKTVFADVWQRPELSIRDRRLITLTVLAMLGRERITPYHVHAALDSGDLDEGQLQEMARQLAYYAGFPVASAFEFLINDIVAERSGDDGKESSR
ncbi:carboxymuconolactone decarboxylase family protein [Nonomuraea sp. NPDC002799]